MALLLPIQWVFAAQLGAIYDSRKPARIYAMRWRIDFTGGEAQPANHAWYVWDANHVGETLFRTLDKHNDPAQRTMI